LSEKSAWGRFAGDMFTTRISLEPISESPEEDRDGGKLHKAKKISGVVFPADQQTSLPLKPGEKPLHKPTPLIAPKSTAVLCLQSAAVGSVRCDHLDSLVS